MDSKENLERSRELQHQTKDAGLAFLMTDLDTALTFAQSALQAGNDSDKKMRNQTNARKGYDAILHLSRRIAPLCTEVEKQDLERKFGILKDALEQLGEKL